MFKQYAALLNFLRARRTMVHLVPPEDCKVTHRVSKTLDQHPLVLLDHQLKNLVKDDDDAIIQTQTPRGRR